MTTLLPTGFEALAPFADRWAIDGSITRAARRGAADPADRAAFFAAAAPLLDVALAHLDRYPIDALQLAEQRLMDMMLTLFLSSWVFKVLWEVVALPVSVPLVRWLKATEQQDPFDRETDFNPFRLG